MGQCLVNEVNAVLREGDYACPESSLMTHHTSTMRMILICNKNCNRLHTRSDKQDKCDDMVIKVAIRSKPREIKNDNRA